MREIKFRLRDRHNKVVGYEKWYEGCWHPDNADEGFSPISGYWEAQPCWLYSIDGEKWNPEPIHHRYKDSVTGLKDKNGKEGYHKDIVERSDKLYVLEWHDNLAGWFLNPLHGGWHGVTDSDFALMCEVVGNVYENPELMEDGSCQ